jgi:hypothetical protein
MTLQAGVVWLLVLLTGCGSASRVVRLDTGQGGPIVLSARSADVRPVELDEDDFKQAASKLVRDVRTPVRPQEAARRLFEVAARSGAYVYEPRSHRISPLSPGQHLTEEEVELTRAYLRWCARTKRPGDCLLLLEEGSTLTGDGRYTLAMALAQGVVLDELMDAFKDMADPRAMLTAVLWTWTTYMILLAVPEPFSKGLAAVMTATLVAYVGVDTFWGLLVGFKLLMDEADRATTFDELRVAGERYGKRMGRDAARALALLATAAIGNTAAGLGARAPTLPGAVQAAAQAEMQAGFTLAAVSEVQTVAVSAEAMTISLAPGAVAMAARGTRENRTAKSRPTGYRAWGSFSGFKSAMGPAGEGKEWHHIVEKTPGNVKRFGPQALHNTENVIPLDKKLHTRISALYSSVRFDITNTTMTVRKWLSSQSLQAQREFGLLAIENVQQGNW